MTRRRRLRRLAAYLSPFCYCGDPLCCAGVCPAHPIFGDQAVRAERLLHVDWGDEWEKLPPAPPLRTKSGRVLTDADIQALADEAERGYDVSRLLDGRSARGRIGRLRALAALERQKRWKLDAVLATDADFIERLTLACEAALAHAEGLVMDTPEDQAVVDKLAGALRMALSGVLQ